VENYVSLLGLEVDHDICAVVAAGCKEFPLAFALLLQQLFHPSFVFDAYAFELILECFEIGVEPFICDGLVFGCAFDVNYNE
jgi:hypothetical protein